MARINKFDSITGENWLTGRYLIPFLKQRGHAIQGVVLDLGCGESPFRNYFVNAKKYIKMDRLAIAPDIVIGDLLDIPLSNTSVDTVLLFQSLTDTPHLERSLREINRVLKIDGELIVFESMSYPEHDLPYDFFRILPEGLKFLGEKVNFEVSECVYLGGLFTRFAMLWNTFVMGKLKSVTLLRPFAIATICVSNISFYILDRIFPHPRLASDFVSVLIKKGEL